MEVPGQYWRTRPGTCGHVFPANRAFTLCRECPRVPARARPDVPVSYPRSVVYSGTERPTPRTSAATPAIPGLNKPPCGAEDHRPGCRQQRVDEVASNHVYPPLFPARTPFRLPGAPRPRKRLSLPEDPRTCPQNPSPDYAGRQPRPRRRERSSLYEDAAPRRELPPLGCCDRWELLAELNDGVACRARVRHAEAGVDGVETAAVLGSRRRHVELGMCQVADDRSGVEGR